MHGVARAVKENQSEVDGEKRHTVIERDGGSTPSEVVPSEVVPSRRG